ncbi:MAG: hypothetical protein K0R67_2850 [Paenibacillus sp.]|nr:hypothetical protein [Paenibacillus sp.]
MEKSRQHFDEEFKRRTVKHMMETGKLNLYTKVNIK